MVDYEFDQAKDESNRLKHGLSLQFGLRVLDDPGHQVVRSFRPIDGEDRYKAIGWVDGKLFTVVYVWREKKIRLISVRRSNASEQRNHDRHSRRPE